MGLFRANVRNNQTNKANEHSIDWNPNWQEAPVGYYERVRSVVLATTKKATPASGQYETWTRNLRNSIPMF